ncbi:uncharacterized protein LOC133911176 [Phragmites australis]|uniref:uncharacterized protein LOC133911176 n=1 Tax=Phragmites australis TaxID=29695 RepID=UPI002D770084|nr:uncharacterized protein LOC133911176 [Phragmites australis]XP_062209366.1 uncharacterized protein LOC133911176 [Phragmites australis]
METKGETNETGDGIDKIQGFTMSMSFLIALSAMSPSGLRFSRISMLDAVRSSSLSDGLPKDFFCVVPKAADRGDGVVLTTTIHTESVDVDEDKLEVEDDEDEDEDEYV